MYLIYNEQGNVPIGLKAKLQDSNMTDNRKGTAWMDALDPNYSKIADMWMQEMVADFGTDHWLVWGFELLSIRVYFE